MIITLIPAHNPGPMTGAGNNTYLLVADGKREALLVDAGTGAAAHLDGIDRGLEGAALETVLVSHAHPDHIAGAPALASRYPNARFMKHVVAGDKPIGAVEWRPLGDNDVIHVGHDRIVALLTPGHAPDHLAFWHEASGTVFSGDLVVRGGTVMIPASTGGDMAKYLRSLERLRDLQPARLLPAHGPEIDDPGAIIASYLRHRRMRERQVLEAVASGPATVESIVESIYHGVDPRVAPAARDTVRAHLDKLVREGRARHAGGRWVAAPSDRPVE
jgi:glyoxylase-like metal-dependent hydrolase (beta-lactamase superfamily II)